jgi:hypothetical protein
MAYGAKKILIRDITPDVAIGVNIPFNTDNVFIPNYSSADAIKNNLINITPVTTECHVLKDTACIISKDVWIIVIYILVWSILFDLM